MKFEEWLSEQSDQVDIDCGCVTTEAFMHWVRKAYEAGNNPAIHGGWALVPIEPTDEMCLTPDVRVGGVSWDGYQSPVDETECREIFKAMLAAAPKPEVK